MVGHRASLESLRVPGVPEFNPMMLLHGEESVEVFQPLIPDSTYVCQETLVDLQDKKKATVMVIETIITDKESGEKIARLLTNLFVRGIGGFGTPIDGAVFTDSGRYSRYQPESLERLEGQAAGRPL